MSEPVYRTTSARIMSDRGEPEFPDPILPSGDTLGPGSWDIALNAATVYDRFILWFWKCEQLPEPVKEIVHLGVQTSEGVLAMCSRGAMTTWPKGDGWTTDHDKVTCPECGERLKGS